MAGERIMVVEDEPKLAALLRDYLAHEGYAPELHARGDGVVAAVRAQAGPTADGAKIAAMVKAALA